MQAMHSEFWRERWRNGEIGWHEPRVNVHLERFWPKLGLPADIRVFVPLCGKSLDLFWLAGQGHRVIGVELSEIAVRDFFAEHRLNPSVTEEPPFRRYRVDELTLLCGDFFALTPDHLGPVDAVFDRASLIALPPGQRQRYAAKITELAPRAISLLITLDYDQSQMTGPPFAVHGDEVRRLYAERYAIAELASCELIDDSPRFRQRGLTSLREHVWRLDPR